MSTMDERGSAPRRLRAGDAERDAVVAQLREHHEAGRLSTEEFEERMSAALAARWRDELPPLMADLPDQDRDRTDGPAKDDGLAGRPGGWGGPPWAGSRQLGSRQLGQGRLGRWSGLPPVVRVLAIIAVVMSIGAVSHGVFPWPLLWVAVGAFWLRRRGWRPAGPPRWAQAGRARTR